ncbi:unnamed protein product [Prorocentrum cordatum]|uniref:Uncharacterized protein n=1 Tax=Prorocentrum cordatum TaxID=2364126 RepID=A0ABN9SUP4_9DINO|nr:unnamed protein product [Polarella glacialis]
MAFGPSCHRACVVGMKPIGCSLGSRGGPPGGLLRASWGPPGASWAPLGASRGPLAGHGALSDELVAHFPMMGCALAAAGLLKLGTKERWALAAEDCAGATWSHQAAPPYRLGVPPKMPLAAAVEVLENFMEKLFFYRQYGSCSAADVVDALLCDFGSTCWASQ